MAMKSEAYVDTSAFVAFTHRADTYHALFRTLFSQPPRLVTTALVVAEGHALALRRYGPAKALEFLQRLDDLPRLTVLGVQPSDLASARRVMQRFADQKLTITDGVGLHVMHERRVTSCWSTDFHLGPTGVPLVIHQH
jgi:predicted nucleic acid-binding protein